MKEIWKIRTIKKKSALFYLKMKPITISLRKRFLIPFQGEV